MRKLILFILLFSVGSVYANPLGSYKQITNAINTGKNIKVVFDLNTCNPKVPFQGFYSPRAIVIFNKTVSFSDEHFTMDNPSFPNQPIIENISYHLLQNGNFTINQTLLDPVNYQEKGTTQPTIICQLGEGVKFWSS